MDSIPIKRLLIPEEVQNFINIFSEADFNDNIIKAFQVLSRYHLDQDLDFTVTQFQKIKSLSTAMDVQLALQVAENDEHFKKTLRTDRRFPRNRAEILFYLDLVTPVLNIEYIDDVPVSTIRINPAFQEFYNSLEDQAVEDDFKSCEEIISTDEDTPTPVLPTDQGFEVVKRKRNKKRSPKVNNNKSVNVKARATPNGKPANEQGLREATGNKERPSRELLLQKYNSSVKLGEVNTPSRREKWRRLPIRECYLDDDFKDHPRIRRALVKVSMVAHFNNVFYVADDWYKDLPNHINNAHQWLTTPDDIFVDDIDLFQQLRAYRKEIVDYADTSSAFGLDAPN